MLFSRLRVRLGLAMTLCGLWSAPAFAAEAQDGQPVPPATPLVTLDLHGEMRTRLDYLPSEGGRPDQEVEENEFSTMLKNKLEEFASGLEGREQTIFRERWLTESPQTLQEIGDKYGVSRERARQLEKRLLGRLRKFLETELGTEIDIAAMAHG